MLDVFDVVCDYAPHIFLVPKDTDWKAIRSTMYSRLGDDTKIRAYVRHTVQCVYNPLIPELRYYLQQGSTTAETDEEFWGRWWCKALASCQTTIFDRFWGINGNFLAMLEESDPYAIRVWEGAIDSSALWRQNLIRGITKAGDTAEYIPNPDDPSSWNPNA